mgnify:CR=1 FL=1
MSDIVKRLRESVKACRALDRSALLAEAADEIERLRVERDGWRAAWENERALHDEILRQAREAAGLK